MSVSSKSSNTQMFRMMLYRRALHPELFELKSRRTFAHGDYEADVWMVPTGHLVRFQVGKRSLTEVVMDRCDHLPELGLVHAIPCLGEKDYEMPREPGDKGIGFVTTIQTESLSDNLYMTTLRELSSYADEAGANSICHKWDDNESVPCLSLIDVQKYRKELHIQSYHLTGSNGLVLRTQSIFEVHQ